MTGDQGSDVPHAEPDITALRRAAASAGCAVSDRMLETFRAQGLIPRPRRAGYRGRAPDWRYPPGSERQLIRLLRWRGVTKDPGVLSVLLWLDGFAITPSVVRRALAGKLRAVTDTIEKEISEQATRLGLDPADEYARGEAISALAQTMAAKRGATAVPRRGRVRADERSRAIATVIRLFGLGENLDGTAADATTVERVLGIAPNGRRHAISDSGPWLTGPAEDLFGAADITGLPNLLHAVEQSTDTDLTAARQTIIALMYHLPLMIRMVSVLTGDENYTGLANLGQIDKQPELAVFLAPMVIAMQRAGWNENLNAITAGLAVLPELAERAQQVLELPEATVRANLAEKPQNVRDQAQRLIDATIDGKLTNRQQVQPNGATPRRGYKAAP